ncbi:MAG: Phosphate transport system permease protein PstA, partial [uncultured Phycisphaerae bacterium]
RRHPPARVAGRQLAVPDRPDPPRRRVRRHPLQPRRHAHPHRHRRRLQRTARGGRRAGARRLPPGRPGPAGAEPVALHAERRALDPVRHPRLDRLRQVPRLGQVVAQRGRPARADDPAHRHRVPHRADQGAAVPVRRGRRGAGADARPDRAVGDPPAVGRRARHRAAARPRPRRGGDGADHVHRDDLRRGDRAARRAREPRAVAAVPHLHPRPGLVRPARRRPRVGHGGRAAGAGVPAEPRRAPLAAKGPRGGAACL